MCIRLYNLAVLVTFVNAGAGWADIARYKKKYASKSVDFVVPLLALLLIGILFLLFARTQGGIGFLFLAVASGLMIYWIREIRIMTRSEDQRLKMSRETDQKNWDYDLIKNSNNEIVFVAEVPGPEDQINVRLTEGLLRIKGGQNFAREIPLDLAQDMGISEYKYRNGVLTVKIQKV